MTVTTFSNIFSENWPGPLFKRMFKVWYRYNWKEGKWELLYKGSNKDIYKGE